MAFWGVEVRPGQPFTHVSDRAKGRLRVCQATIGIGFVASATKRILVQCNVGNRSPVLLCSLCPGQTDSCPMGVEFEESEDVIFSVIGPWSVHLVGYYLSSAHSIGIDESESYGEDIANTDTERSNHFSDDDEYEDSFIDDNDPKVSPPPPISYDEELLEDVKPKKSGHRKLQKKYQKVDSDDDHSDAPALEMEDDEKLPISSVYNRTSERNKDSNGRKQPDKIHEANHNGVSSKSAETPVLDNVPASSKQKKRKRSHVKETAALEANVHVNHDVVSLEISCQDEGKTEKMGKDMQTKHTEEWNLANNGNSIVSTKECENSKGKEKKEKKMVKKREEENLKTEGAMEVEVPVPSTMEMQAPLPSTLCENSKEKEMEKEKEKMEKKREDNLKTEGTMEVEVPVPSTMEVQAPLPSTEFENSEKVKKREENLKTEGTMEVEISVPSTMEVQAPLHLIECESSKEKEKKEKKRVEEKLKTEGTMEMEAPVPSTMEVQAPLTSTLCENVKEKVKKKKKMEKKREDNLKTEGTMEVEVPVPSTMKAQAPLPSTEFENSKEKVKKREEENLMIEGTMEVEVSVPSTMEVQRPLHLTECENSKVKEKKKEKKRVEEKLKTEGTMEMEVSVPSAMELQAPLPSTEGNATLKRDTDTAKQSPNLKSSQVRTLPNGMIIEELELGKADGKMASQGKKVSVLIIGRLKVDGRIIDSNIDGPFKFRIGRGVIEGLNDGVKGMQAGGRRKVTIPPSLGFGSEGHGDIIPPNSWLVYDIELVKVY